MTDDVRDVNTETTDATEVVKSTQPQAKPVIRRPRHLTPTLQRNLPRRRVSGTVTCGECRLP